MSDITLWVAFVAGLISFFAPCVFPMVPAFFAYLGGVALDNNASAKRAQVATFLASVFFVLGFVTVFAVLGFLLHSALAQVSATFQISVARIGGAIVIFFGLYLMGLFKISFLEKTRHIPVHKKLFPAFMRETQAGRIILSFVFGAAFAAGWTPCVGAALGAIFGLATVLPSKAFALLVSYAVGLGAPFLVMGFFAGEIERYLNRSFSWTLYLNILFGGILVFFGMLAFTQNLALCREVLWQFPF